MKFLVILLGLVCALTHGAPGVEKVNAPHPAGTKEMEIIPSGNTRVIGGKRARGNQFPYVVEIHWGTTSPSPQCTGSLISDSVVLTAARCIKNYGSYRIAAGTTTDNGGTPEYQTRAVDSVVVHEKWSGGDGPSPYDIGLLKLSSPFRFSAVISVIKLPSQSAAAPTGSAVIAAWGYTSPNDTRLSRNLQYIDTEVIPNSKCAQDLTKADGLDDSLVCTSGLENKSICKGDFGGPLVQDGVQIGIASWSTSPCATSNAPSVYTRVSAYVDWINANL